MAADGWGTLIGNWDIYLIFKVSAERVFTFREFQRTLSGRWAVHEILHNKPRSEWIGPGMDESSLEILLDAQLGVQPASCIKTLKRCVEQGIVGGMFIGGVNYGKYYIDQISEMYDIVLNRGEIARATLQVGFKEYN